MDLEDLSMRKCEHRAVYREVFHFLVRTTSTNPVTDLHFDTKNNGCRLVLHLVTEIIKSMQIRRCIFNNLTNF